MKRKILSLVLALTILASMCAFMPLSVSAETYSPVATVDWNGHTYHLYDESMKWEEAKQYCENSGGHLVTITSEDEQETVVSLLNYGANKNGYWMGGYTETDRIWKWITGEKFSYSNWDEDEPNNYRSRENVIMLINAEDDTPTKWNDMADFGDPGYEYDVKNMGFICEWDYTADETLLPIATTDWNGHTYHVYDESMTWEEAKQYCENSGGHLVTITSAEEQKTIEELLAPGRKKQYWIGMKRVDNELKWITNEPLSYKNWDRGEPNANLTRGFREEYVHIYNAPNPAISGSQRFKWNDMYVDNTFPGEETFFSLDNVGFICEFEGTDNFDKPNTNKEDITVYLNNKKIEFDVPPIIENGRTLVPVRAIFEEMGMDVLWDGITSTVTATGNGNSISMRINDTKATVNGRTYFIDVPAKVIDGRTVVPVRFISESLDAFVEWNSEDKIVNISDRVHFFIKFNNVNFNALLSNDYTFDTWYRYYLDSIQNNKAKWASASILKFWSNPFTYWSETDTQKITTAVLIDALTNDAAVSSIEQTANDFFIQSLNEDINALSDFMSDKATDYIGDSAKEVDANLLKLQETKNYIYSNKDLSKLTPEQLNNHNNHIREYEDFMDNEIASESYKKLRLEKLNTMLTKAGIVCDIASLANVGVSEYNTIKALIYTKDYYTEGLDIIYNNLSNTDSDKILKKAINEVKATMNQSMVESIQQYVNSVGGEFLKTSIAETIAKEFVVKSLKIGAEKFLVKMGVNATKAATITSGIGNAANVVGAAVTAGQITTAICDVVLSTGSGIDASYDLRILMDIEQRISGMLNDYILDLMNHKNTIENITSITTVLKAIRMQASLLTNVIYNSDHNSSIDKGFRLIFTDENAYDDTYDHLYEMEISRIKNIKFINY